MTERQAKLPERDDRVVPFNPRQRSVSTSPKSSRISATTSQDAAAPKAGPPQDFRHRMIANLAATLFAVVLTAIGVWLATSLTHMRQTQDCVMMGLRDCGTSAPHS